MYVSVATLALKELLYCSLELVEFLSGDTLPQEWFRFFFVLFTNIAPEFPLLHLRKTALPNIRLDLLNRVVRLSFGHALGKLVGVCGNVFVPYHDPFTVAQMGIGQKEQGQPPPTNRKSGGTTTMSKKKTKKNTQREKLCYVDRIFSVLSLKGKGCSITIGN